eukprot:1746515-Rhodomonas_salina.1
MRLAVAAYTSQDRTARRGRVGPPTNYKRSGTAPELFRDSSCTPLRTPPGKVPPALVAPYATSVRGPCKSSCTVLIRYVSTGYSLAPYAMSVPDIAEHARRQIDPCAMLVPDIA